MVAKRSLPSRESSEEGPHSSKRGLQSLARTVSPPPATKKRKNGLQDLTKSAAAAVEAGEADVTDHLAFYSSHLLAAIRPATRQVPRLEHGEWVKLYERHAGSHRGCHFVVHQHDHPVAGTHYDLRLQCNPTSSISFAIMYGLPGDPNSSRLNRKATETRVHCLWNHLIETASHSTGSMLIWDTGEYEILPYNVEGGSGDVTDSDTDEDGKGDTMPEETEQDKLHAAFHNRKIKLRLHGTRLPPNYTLALRLTKDNDRAEQPKKPSRRRRREAPVRQALSQGNPDSEADTGDEDQPPGRGSLSSLSRLASPPLSPPAARIDGVQSPDEEEAMAAASDDEDESIRANNAYPGAVNDIGSIHQRKWYLSVDRVTSGFVKGSTKSSSGFVDTHWMRRMPEAGLADGQIGVATGFDRFVVGGRETERSVVTGRLAKDILADEGVTGYVPRGLWRPITE